MKILHTNFHRGWGGQSNRILTECRGLAAQGHEVTLAVPEGSELSRRGGDAGLNVFTDVHFARGFRPTKLAHDIGSLRALFRDRNFDIIHTHGSQDSWAVAYSLIGFKPRPIVLRTRHNLFPIRDHFMNRLLYAKWTDGLVCISEAILEDCASKSYLNRENLSLVHSAVDEERFASKSGGDEIRSEFNLAGKYVAGITGRLRSEKGHVHLFDALPKVIAAAPDFVLLVIGAGSLEDELKQRVESLGVGRHVIFTGFRTDVPRFLSALNLFVMPSISEGLGTAIIEAAMAGLPIVASRVGGIPDIIEDGRGGLLVPPANPEALADAILALYRDRSEGEKMAQAARNHALEKFTTKLLAEKTEAVYGDWMRRRGNGI